MMGFRLEGIDHVALTVRDVARSVTWYRETLGLERRHEAAWGDHPAIVCAGDTCLALFPCGAAAPGPTPDRKAIAMQHLAFRVGRKDFEGAQAALQARGIAFSFQDHAISHSIYFSDPDGHRLEITTYEV
jgi:catechol 2,3-dioxygenase-like lactoylglutathione lyase family enzyme